MSTQSTANATLKDLLTRLVNQQQSQQAQLDTIRDVFKANKDEGAIIAKPTTFKGNADDVARNVAFPFEGKWETFEKQFKVRFGSANEKVDAIWELEQMKQGNKAVTLYCQDFRDAGVKTGLSDANLMICFQSGLNLEVKKLLVTMDLAQGDPKDLDNLEDCSCRAERALEAEGNSTQKHTEITTTTISATQTNPVGGNGKTCEDFMRAMCNSCYGCGATDHTKCRKALDAKTSDTETMTEIAEAVSREQEQVMELVPMTS
ncbi:hypothetical protein PQX77_018788 [Marasmius sp. AFHP31]|nr:hypothetical protein PQX77_018788 [Marasmius sp. AFHP31]